MSRLLGIQALRAAAAGMVVYAHALMTYREKVAATTNITTLISYGELGVALFFCISGFIIYKSTLCLEPGMESMSIFTKKRLIRIVPAYWAATLIYAAKLKMQGTEVSASNLLKSLAFIPYTDGSGLMRPVLGAGWTLNYEMLFYAIMACCLLWSVKWRYAVAAGLISALITFGQVTPTGPPTYAALQDLRLVSEPILLYFLLGLGIAQLSQHKLSSHLSTSWLVGILLAALALTAFICLAALAQLTDTERNLAQLIACGVAVWFTANAYEADDFQGSFFSRSVVAWGDGSYSTYLTHGFIMGPAARIIYKTNFPISASIFAALMVLICSWAGDIIHRKVEKPIIKSLSQRLLQNQEKYASTRQSV